MLHYFSFQAEHKARRSTSTSLNKHCAGDPGRCNDGTNQTHIDLTGTNEMIMVWPSSYDTFGE